MALDHGEDVVRFWDDGWRAPTARMEATSTSDAEFVPFDSVRGDAIEAARADIAHALAAADHELAQVTMNNRVDRDDL